MWVFKVDKSVYLKGIEGILKGDFFMWLVVSGMCTRGRCRDAAARLG